MVAAGSFPNGSNAQESDGLKAMRTLEEEHGFSYRYVEVVNLTSLRMVLKEYTDESMEDTVDLMELIIPQEELDGKHLKIFQELKDHGKLLLPADECPV